MKRSLKELTGYEVETIDGTRAKVKDFLFDEETWVIRYMEVDFGGLFKSKRILIPRMLLNNSQVGTKLFLTELTRDDIENCPKPQDDLTVSRKFEEELNKYYRVNNYWTYSYPPTGTGIGIGMGMGMFNPPRYSRSPAEWVNENDLGTGLRSFSEVKGYEIQTFDSKLGHMDDMFADDEGWQIAYVLVDTSNWLPWSKKVVLPIGMIIEISYQRRVARVSLHTETIKDAPEFNPDQSIDVQYKTKLQDYYEKHLHEN